MMITREQWDAMTPQQQWDLVQMLDASVDRTEAEHEAHSQAMQLDVRKSVIPRYIIDTLMDAGIEP